MPTAPSYDDILTIGIGQAVEDRPELAFREGDYSLAVMDGAAAMGDMEIRLSAQATKETFLDGAEGDVLTALVDDRYNLQRIEATYAEVSLTFTRTSGGAGGTIDAGTRVRTGFNIKGEAQYFTTNVDQVVAGAANGPFTILATAEIAGSDGNVAADEITFIEDTLFDSTFSVTNAAEAGGGNGRESDAQLRTRARDFFRTLRRGTLAALEYGAKQVTTVRNSKAIEDDDTGEVTLTVSDEDGNSTMEMLSDVEIELENWRAPPAIISVVGGEQLPVSITYTLTVRDGYNVASRVDEFAAAVTNRMKKLNPGETFYLDMGTAALVSVAKEDVLNVVETEILIDGVSSPIEDIEPEANQTVRADTITVVAA